MTDQHAALDYAMSALERGDVREAVKEALHDADQEHGLTYGLAFDTMRDFVWALIADRFTSPEPVPATNQAGEVAADIDALNALDAWAETHCADHDPDYIAKDDVVRYLAALATQPATSQEGEDMAQIVKWIDEAIERAKRHGATEGVWLFGSQWRAVRAILAATPTPPTLSEDLREAKRLVEYLFGDQRNGDGVRVVDLCFTAFMNRDKPNPEDGERSDWFNDTKPLIDKGIAALKDRLLDALAATAVPSDMSGDALRMAVAKLLPIGNDSLPGDRVIPIYVRMDELRALHALALAQVKAS